LTTLGDIALAGEVPLDALLQRIVEVARGLLHARYAALGVFDAQGRVTKFFTTGITAEERDRIGPLPIGSGLLGHIVKERRIVRTPRMADHPASAGFPPNHPTMTSFLGGPIRRDDVVYGNLYLTDRLGAEEFSEADEELLGILATQAAVAIENAQRFRTLAELNAREQAALRQAELERSSLAAIFDSMTDIVFTVDLDGRIVRLNRQASLWSGRSSEEVGGKPADEVFPLVDDVGRSVPVPVNGELTPFETLLISPTGERIPVERVISPIRDATGQVLGVVQVLRDVRPQREVEQLKANIISLVSHELRTPLSHIKGYASSLLQPDVEWDPETQRDFIASIERQADRLARLIGDLLEISRLDAGGVTRLERAPVPPATLVERGIRQASPNARGHPITTAVAADLPLVLADLGHIERVLSNLVENAAKYSPPGAPIAIEVGCLGEGVVFAVRDQGTGLTDEEKSHLFERFYRSPRVKHRTPGTGLGLAICREIVQAHEGTIWAESMEGEGSVFRFTLPRAKIVEGIQR
jgi:PAS domain S-box-containing protein